LEWASYHLMLLYKIMRRIRRTIRAGSLSSFLWMVDLSYRKNLKSREENSGRCGWIDAGKWLTPLTPYQGTWKNRGSNSWTSGWNSTKAWFRCLKYFPTEGRSKKTNAFFNPQNQSNSRVIRAVIHILIARIRLLSFEKPYDWQDYHFAVDFSKITKLEDSEAAWFFYINDLKKQIWACWQNIPLRF